MIGYLKGKVVDLDFNKIIILTNSGVGYEIAISDITYTKLGIETETSLFIYHYKTENSENLFGFLEKLEKQVFEELIKISGVGGKVALQILSLGVVRLSQAIRYDDKRTIESIKGIGKKMAEKIVLELKDKEFINIGISESFRSNTKSNTYIDKNIYDSVRSTLSAMGYNPKDIDRVLENLPEGFNELGKIIPFMIKELS